MVRAFYLALIAAVLVSIGWAVTTVYDQGSQVVPRLMAMVQPGALSPKHAFIDGNCESCHTPLRGVAASACIGCHATNDALLARQSTAFHASLTDCRGCHIEHQGSIRPVQMDHDVLVALGQQRADTSSSFLPWQARAALRTLTGHTSPPAERALDCFGCHSNRNPHHDGSGAGCCASPTASVGSLFGRDCAACHVSRTWDVVGYKHPSPRSTECAQCHQPPPSHSMMHFEMVSKPVAGQEHADVQQCYLCHQTNAWNDIKGVGWYKHH